MKTFKLFFCCNGILVLLACFQTYASFYESNLKQPAIRCDYLIVSANDFVSQAESLAAYRFASQRDLVETPLIAKIGDIYNQFPDSATQAGKLKAFLYYATHTWSQKPVRILLLGGSTAGSAADSAPILATSKLPAYVATTMPSYLLYRLELVDEWFITFNGSVTYPLTLALGRLPVNDSASCINLITKIIKFETMVDRKNSDVLAISDDSWDSGVGCSTPTIASPKYQYFKNLEQHLSTFTPTFDVSKIHTRMFSTASIPSRLLQNYNSITNGIKKGNWLVFFEGSGFGDWWGRIIHAYDFDLFVEAKAADKYFIVCSPTQNSIFANTDSVNHIKLLGSSECGLVAFLSSGSSKGIHDSLMAFRLADNILKSISKKQVNDLGSVLIDSKAGLPFHDTSLVRGFQLLGDPAMVIPRPGITLNHPDTITAQANQLIDVSGTTSSITNGKVIGEIYNVARHIDTTVYCNFRVNFYDTRPLLDTFATNVINHQFSAIIRVPNVSDSVQPVKITFYANGDYPDEVGALFIRVKGGAGVLSGNKNLALVFEPVLHISRIPGKISFFINSGNTNEIIMRIYNLNGKTIDRRILSSNRFDWNIRSVPAGMYLVSFKIGDRLLHKKIFVTR